MAIMNFKNQDSLIEYNTLLENFKLKFNEILNLKMGMKIGKIIENDNKKEKDDKDDVKNNKKDDKKDDEKLNLFISGSYCTYENNVYQNISRWWNNENRGKTFTYLDKDFTKF